MDLGLDLQQYITDQLKGSSMVDSAIAQVFGASPIEMKLKEIGYLLERDRSILNFEYYFDPRCLAYKYRVVFDGAIHYGTIMEEVLRCVHVDDIVQEIARLVMTEIIEIDPEWICESENEQAFYDAAYDYELIV